MYHLEAPSKTAKVRGVVDDRQNARLPFTFTSKKRYPIYHDGATCLRTVASTNAYTASSRKHPRLRVRPHMKACPKVMACPKMKTATNCSVADRVWLELNCTRQSCMRGDADASHYTTRTVTHHFRVDCISSAPSNNWTIKYASTEKPGNQRATTNRKRKCTQQMSTALTSFARSSQAMQPRVSRLETRTA